MVVRAAAPPPAQEGGELGRVLQRKLGDGRTWGVMAGRRGEKEGDVRGCKHKKEPAGPQIARSARRTRSRASEAGVRAGRNRGRS